MEEVQEATPVEMPEEVQEAVPLEIPEGEPPQGAGLSNRQIAGMVLVFVLSVTRNSAVCHRCSFL